MKKVFGIVLLITGLIATVCGIVSLINVISTATASVSIIGGADGPTSIFLAGKMGNPLTGIIVAGIALVIIGIVMLIKEKKKK